MASNPINVNAQMQQLADKAVIAAREKFGVNLDFTENSLQQLDTLLQQAHEGYKQNTPIENTVRTWGSYFGEVIRHSLGGDWIVDQKNVFLQTESRRLDPLGQVRSRIVDIHPNNIPTFFQELKPRIQNNPKKQSNLIKCPYCAEEIQEAAIVCEHCGRDLRISISPDVQKKKMALVKCPDCGSEISSEAEACPHCGKPSSVIHCPYCKSTNVTKLNYGTEAVAAISSALFAGPFSRRRVRQFTCNNCRHSW